MGVRLPSLPGGLISGPRSRGTSRPRPRAATRRASPTDGRDDVVGRLQPHLLGPKALGCRLTWRVGHAREPVGATYADARLSSSQATCSASRGARPRCPSRPRWRGGTAVRGLREKAFFDTTSIRSDGRPRCQHSTKQIELFPTAAASVCESSWSTRARAGVRALRRAHDRPQLRTSRTERSTLPALQEHRANALGIPLPAGVCACRSSTPRSGASSSSART